MKKNYNDQNNNNNNSKTRFNRDNKFNNYNNNNSENKYNNNYRYNNNYKHNRYNKFNKHNRYNNKFNYKKWKEAKEREYQRRRLKKLLNTYLSKISLDRIIARRMSLLQPLQKEKRKNALRRLFFIKPKNKTFAQKLQQNLRIYKLHNPDHKKPWKQTYRFNKLKSLRSNRFNRKFYNRYYKYFNQQKYSPKLVEKAKKNIFNKIKINKIILALRNKYGGIFKTLKYNILKNAILKNNQPIFIKHMLGKKIKNKKQTETIYLDNNPYRYTQKIKIDKKFNKKINLTKQQMINFLKDRKAKLIKNSNTISEKNKNILLILIKYHYKSKPKFKYKKKYKFNHYNKYKYKKISKYSYTKFSNKIKYNTKKNSKYKYNTKFNKFNRYNNNYNKFNKHNKYNNYNRYNTKFNKYNKFNNNTKYNKSNNYKHNRYNKFNKFNNAKYSNNNVKYNKSNNRYNNKFNNNNAKYNNNYRYNNNYKHKHYNKFNNKYNQYYNNKFNKYNKFNNKFNKYNKYNNYKKNRYNPKLLKMKNFIYNKLQSRNINKLNILKKKLFRHQFKKFILIKNYVKRNKFKANKFLRFKINTYYNLKRNTLSKKGKYLLKKAKKNLKYWYIKDLKKITKRMQKLKHDVKKKPKPKKIKTFLQKQREKLYKHRYKSNNKKKMDALVILSLTLPKYIKTYKKIINNKTFLKKFKAKKRSIIEKKLKHKINLFLTFKKKLNKKIKEYIIELNEQNEKNSKKYKFISFNYKKALRRSISVEHNIKIHRKYINNKSKKIKYSKKYSISYKKLRYNLLPFLTIQKFFRMKDTLDQILEDKKRDKKDGIKYKWSHPGKLTAGFFNSFEPEEGEKPFFKKYIEPFKLVSQMAKYLKPKRSFAQRHKYNYIQLLKKKHILISQKNNRQLLKRSKFNLFKNFKQPSIKFFDLFTIKKSLAEQQNKKVINVVLPLMRKFKFSELESKTKLHFKVLAFINSVKGAFRIDKVKTNNIDTFTKYHTKSKHIIYKNSRNALYNFVKNYVYSTSKNHKLYWNKKWFKTKKEIKLNNFYKIFRPFKKQNSVQIKKKDLFKIKHHFKTTIIPNFYGKQRTDINLKNNNNLNIHSTQNYLWYFERQITSLLVKSHYAPTLKNARHLIRYGNIFINNKRQTNPYAQANLFDIIRILNANAYKRYAYIFHNFKFHLINEKSLPNFIERNSRVLTTSIVNIPKVKDYLITNRTNFISYKQRSVYKNLNLITQLF